MAKIIPHLWFDTQAEEAARFYVDLFEDSNILHVSTINDTPSGDASTVAFTLAGMEFAAISAGPDFFFNQSISLMVACATGAEVDRLHRALAVQGRALMPLGSYDFSERYAWIVDRYGLNWQLMQVEDMSEHKRITPSLLFGGDNCGKVEEAIDFYAHVFPKTDIGYSVAYQEGEAPDRRARTKYARMKIFDLDLVMMDDGTGGAADFNESFSLIVNCDSQEEIDYYWEKLSHVPEAEACGWLKDKYGVSWQIVPTILGELMQGSSEAEVKRITQAFLKMKKFDIAALVVAKKG